MKRNRDRREERRPVKMGTLCYLERDNAYLMLYRNKKENDMHEGFWVGLGGKIEQGESPEDCVVREVFEESGLVISKPQLRGILTFPVDLDGSDWYVFLYTATDFSGELIECNEGELHWVPTEKLDTLHMHEGDRYFLQWIKEHHGIFSAKIWNLPDGKVDYTFVMYES